MTGPTQCPGGPRQLGRPRDPKLDAAILDATLRVLADCGYTAVTMEAVAALAGVGKATLYRRFPGKEQLVVEAVASLGEPPERVRGAGVRDELVALLEAIRRKSDSSLAGKIFPRLLGAGADNPELMRRYREQVLDPRRARFVAVLQRGVDEGLLRADLDLGYAVDLLVGPMAYRNLIRNDPGPGPELAGQIVDDILLALAPRPASHLPEQP
ncbi:MAG: TetR/AcrR family transcriptional regulator [Actinobacteria bacterium]|nr:TetR/AcrR family transcriptional regulator [Actinomycetota bacterium]MBW3648628.1 TetR/AcrR family transcriptional regulator [Actinomycetota bacterium]